MSDLYRAFSAVNTELEQTILTKASKQLTLGRDNDSFDLMPIYFILVTAGVWNKNTDVFDIGEVWRARHSPTHKPVNLLHKGTKIIGHIVDNIAVNAEDLKPIPEDTDEGDLPTKLHIVTCAVLYKFFDEKQAQAEIDEIIKGVERGEWAVSMECLFKGFSFALMNSKGEQKILPRNNETKSLTKHLRQYGGSGKIYHYSLGRILEQITFSAAGLVKNPANPDSIISDSLNIFGGATAEIRPVYIQLDNVSNGENQMADTTISHDLVKEHPLYKDLQDKHARLASDHAALHSRCEDMKNKLDAIHQHTMADEVAALKKQIADMNDEALAAKETADKAVKDKEEMDEACKAAKAAVTAIQGENDAMKATLEAYKKAERGSARIAALMEVDKSLTREKAEQTVAQFDELSDSSFKAMLTTVANYASKAPKEVTPEKVLSNAKAEQDVQYGGGVTNTVETTRAAVNDWWASQRQETKTKVKGV